MERLFVAIDISDSQVADALKRIACGAPNVDWTAPENLHLTLAFIGDPPQPVRQTARLFEAIAVEPFTASLLGVETYDLGNGYSALCARVEKTAELMSLQCQCVAVLARTEADLKGRSYRPHVTLGLVESKNLHKSRPWLKRHERFQAECFVSAFHLYASHRIGRFVELTRIRRYSVSGVSLTPPKSNSETL
ncbi:RNA 2',3'-cyclic phosphodiesterase [Rhizobiales bacterium]|jgi:2'-5' RNA ligase|uniref:RNA 2',3'-cyclic phosphodiesterase n=1 Tax=Rhizobium sp. 11_C7_N12_5 TaxID=3240770 RepID=UPI000DDEF94D